MPSNEERRQAARDKLAKQNERREADARKRKIKAGAIAGVVVVALVAAGCYVWLPQGPRAPLRLGAEDRDADDGECGEDRVHGSAGAVLEFTCRAYCGRALRAGKRGSGSVPRVDSAGESAVEARRRLVHALEGDAFAVLCVLLLDRIEGGDGGGIPDV